jgi:hypothetical protein
VLNVEVNIVRENTKALLDASYEFRLEVNLEMTKYMLVSCCQIAGQKHGIKIANRYFENVAKLKYLGATLTN